MKNQQLKDQKRRRAFSKNENNFFVYKGSQFLDTNRSCTLKMLDKNNVCKVKNRCLVSQRDRAVFRRFRLTRGILRNFLSFGKVPGIIKSSW